MPINEPKEILEILKALDKTTKEQLDKAIKNAEKEESQEAKQLKEEEKKAIANLTEYAYATYDFVLKAKDAITVLNLIETQKAELEPIKKLNIPVKTLVAEWKRLEDLEDNTDMLKGEIEKKNKMIDELKKLIEEINETARNWQDSSLERLQIIHDMATEIYLKEPLRYNNKFEVIEYFTKLVEGEKKDGRE